MSSITTERDKTGRPIKYVARYRTPEGASRKQRFDKKAEAQAFLDNIGSSKAAGAFIDSKRGRIKFGEYARDWIANQPHRENTALSVESIFRVHVFPKWENRTIASITVSEVQAWVTGLPLAPSTVEVVYGKVAAVFRAAVDDRVIAHSPCGRKIRRPRAPGVEIEPMDPAAIAKMASAVNPRFRALVLTLAGTGLRPAEALGLTVPKVNFLKRTIRVDRQLVTVANQVPKFGPTKTAGSVRTIPCPQSVLDVLAAHLAEFGPGPDELIFTDTKGDPIRRNALGHVWRRAAVVAGVKDRTPHDLRHYAASVLIAQGANVKAVQKHLGHANASTTLDTYSHLFPDSDDITRRALDAGFAQVVSTSCPANVAEG